MFQLTKNEWKELITICDNLPDGVQYSPATPFAFTEQGVAMLSSGLNSDRAVAVNIQIMRVFTRMRQLLSDNIEVKLEIAKIKHAVEQITKKQKRSRTEYRTAIRVYRSIAGNESLLLF